ncbi:MAG TPA: hypothetical protein VFX86_03685 [Candidatus Saccharimonadales bacterium]|nr:hypothetical protein [Candidatus Saccharimonadales bacterium]
MENQVITPTQNDNQNQAPQPNLPGPDPQPSLGPTPIKPDPVPPTNWGANEPRSGGAFGRLSLLLSSSAVGIFILLIFVTGLVDSLSKAYIWFFIILALGVTGLVLGLLSEKGKDRINLGGLVGIILSVIVCVNCLTIGSFYIKTQIELNKFKADFENTDFSNDLEFNYSTP